MMRQVFSCIEQYQMIGRGDTVLAAVSGGADSVSLLLLLAAYRESIPFTLRAVHIEHGIRGEESLEDAAFVKALCDRAGVPLTTVRVDAPSLAGQAKISLEEAARKLRYEAFECCMDDACTDAAGGHVKTALAHNMEDQAETVLFHLARGSGLDGLGGMRPVRGRFIRPLLFVSRSAIEEYLRSCNETWRTDSSNLSDSYTRNRIRHHVLPLMEQQIHAGAVRHICETASQARQAEAYLREMAVQDLLTIRRECGTDKLVLDAELLASWPALRQEYALREAMRCWYETIFDGRGLKDIGRTHIQSVAGLLTGNTDRHLDLPGRVRVDCRGHALILSAAFGKETDEEKARIGKMAERVVISGDGEYPFGDCSFFVRFMSMEQLLSSGEDFLTENRYTKWLCCDTIKGTLCLRRRQKGDRLVINALGNRRKVKDYLIDEKVPRAERDDLILLADDDTVWWIVGCRIGENVKITGQTGHIIKISSRKDG